MNVAFYISGKATRFRKIFNAADAKVLASIKLVFSDAAENQDLQAVVEPHGIAYICVDHAGIQKTADKSRNRIMSDAMLAEFRTNQIDYCFSFGDHLLVGPILDEYKNKIINFHPSVLPMFPGLMSIDQAVDANSSLLGNTAHFIDAGTDTGPVIMQNVLSREVFEAGGYDAVLDQQITMFNQIFMWLEADRLTVEGQRVHIKNANYNQVVFFPQTEQ